MLFFVILSSVSAVDWTPVFQIIRQGIDNRAFSGAVLAVASSNYTYFTMPFGTLAYSQGIYQESVNKDTFFDMASLTKISSTLMSLMRLVDEKSLKVDDLVTKFIPAYDNNMKRNTTIKNLLLHNAGLAAIPPANIQGDQVVNWTINCKLEYPIGTKFVYSDLGFILLGKIVEAITGKTLDKFALQVNTGMAMRSIRYNLPSSQQHLAAATQYDPIRKVIRGTVHDERAYKMGGVAGHAGHFGTATDIMQMMQIMLNNGTPPGAKYPQFSKETVTLFTTRVDNLPYSNSRALGWDTVPNQQYPPCGNHFSARSFGHTGFTGTSAWADREKDLAIVLLTNAVHPTRLSKQLIIKLRSDVSDAVVEALGYK